MLKDEYLKALRDGMKGELESIMLYEAALANTQDSAVQDFFKQRITEEERHYNYLLTYYNDISNDKQLCKLDLQGGMSSPIMTDEIIERVAQNQTLFAAISTGVLLEKTAFDYYKKCAKEVDTPELKSLFVVLADWEMQHYDDLITIEADAEKDYWNRNRFEPF